MVRCVGQVAYELALPPSMPIHPVFHVALLQPYNASGAVCHQLPPDPVQVEGVLEYEVACIMHHCLWGHHL